MVHEHFLQIVIKWNVATDAEFFTNFHIGYGHQNGSGIVGNHVGMPTSDVSGTYDGKVDDIR